MAQQRRRDTRAELRVRKEVWALGLRYRVDIAPLPGLRRRADLLFARAKVAVYVDGCFWHRCPLHASTPKSNREWWVAKLEANVERDRDTDHRLTEAGWLVIRVWEHDDPASAARAIHAAVTRRTGARRPGPLPT